MKSSIKALKGTTLRLRAYNESLLQQNGRSSVVIFGICRFTSNNFLEWNFNLKLYRSKAYINRGPCKVTAINIIHRLRFRGLTLHDLDWVFSLMQYRFDGSSSEKANNYKKKIWFETRPPPIKKRKKILFKAAYAIIVSLQVIY